MKTKGEKKEQIREQIVEASRVYRDKLAGKVFLYVVGGEWFEVVFQTNCFMHLTGVSSQLSAQDFYEKAKAARLTTEQISFDEKHSYQGAKKKLPCLLVLPELTNSLVCVVKSMRTMTLTYTIGLTNLHFTVGLTENIDSYGNKRNDWFLPRTLRVRDKAIEASRDAEFVDFIFSKDASHDTYDKLEFAEKERILPENLRPLLSQRLAEALLD